MPPYWNYGPHWTPDRSKKLCELLIVRGGYCRQVAALLAYSHADNSSNLLGAMARLAYIAAEPSIAGRLDHQQYSEFQREVKEIVFGEEHKNSDIVMI